jgi:formylglycine-generating enzyme required for sulfatase activity
MVLVWDVQDRRVHYCVDRWEAMVVDDTTAQNLSPYYPPEAQKAAFLEKVWRDQHGTGTELEQRTDLPPLPAWQKQKKLKPRAVSKAGVLPQAYASGKDAAVACGNAGKRLCTLHEWRTACRGEQDRDFPYGSAYEHAVCNVVREVHPGILLWDNPSINHTDPRFNLFSSKTGPLLRRTGATVKCTSVWGADGILDMVGNLDEWIDDPEGTFVGAFYARGKKDGCQSKVENHTLTYADYSTGIRCCRDALF